MSIRTWRRPGPLQACAIATGSSSGLTRASPAAEPPAEHGALLRALAEASSQDQEARRAWRDFIDPVVTAHAAKIAEEVARGRIRGIDPERTARALIGMNLQYFFDELVDRARPDIKATADTLLAIWERALYPASSSSSRS